MAQWDIPRINNTELASATPSDGDIVFNTDTRQILVGHSAYGSNAAAWVNVNGTTDVSSDTYKITTEQLASDAVQVGNISDNQITFAKVEQIAALTLLGNDGSATGDIEELTVANVTDMLDINLGDRLERIDADNAFNVKDHLLANTYEFSTTSNRNAGDSLNDDTPDADIRYNTGDIAVIKPTGSGSPRVFIYVGDPKTPTSSDDTVVDGDWIELTLSALNTLTNTQIADDAISTDKIQDANITLAKMADNSVDTDQIVDDSIQTVHLQDSQITTAKINDSAVTTAKINADAVDGTKIADDSIDSEHITDGAIDLAHMSANSVDSDQYVDGSIDTAHIADDQITNAKMADNSVDSDQYVDGSIDTVHIADSAITNAKIADGTIAASKLAGSIEGADLSDGAIDTDQLAADAVDGTKIEDDAVDSEHIADGAIDTAHIADDQVTFAKMQNVTGITVLGKSTTGSGSIEEISLSTLSGGTMLNSAENTRDTINTALAAGTHNGIDVTTSDSDNSISISHADTSSASSVTESNRTYISGITLDTYGHVTATDTQGITAGNGVQITDGGEISVTSTHAAETVVFTSIANRNAARAAGWNQGDIAIVNLSSDTHSYIYHGTNGNTSATDDDDWAELSFSSGDNTTYSFASGTTGSFTVTPAVGGVNGTAQTVTVGHPTISAASSANNSGRTYIQDITLDSNGHVTGLTSATETVVDTNTTYAAGSGLSLSGTTFSHDDTSSQASVDNSGNTFIQDVTLDTYGHVTGLTSAGATDTNTTYTAGDGLALTGTAFSHSDTSSQASVNNSGRTYIQDITLDTYGHVTGIASATETVTNTNTTYAAGSGLSLSGTTFSHSDTSSQASVNNSGRTYIQDITLDTYGHVTGIASATETVTNTNTTYTAGTGLTLSDTEFSVTSNGIGATQLNVSGNGTSGQLLTSDGDGSFSWTDASSGGGGGGGGLGGPWYSPVSIPQTSSGSNGQVQGANISIPSDATQALVRVVGFRNRRGTGGVTLRVNGGTTNFILNWTNNEENERGYACWSALFDLESGTITELGKITSVQSATTAIGSVQGSTFPWATQGTAITSFNFGSNTSGHSSASGSIQSNSFVWFNAS